MTALRIGDAFPHVALTRIDGEAIAYRDIWQHRNLLLVVLPAHGEEEYARNVERHHPALRANDTAVVLTRDAIPGVPSPGVVAADRWGEIFLVSGTLLPPAELIEWMRYAQMQCSQCWGDSRHHL